jgi:hypothetical protein
MARREDGAAAFNDLINVLHGPTDDVSTLREEFRWEVGEVRAGVDVHRGERDARLCANETFRLVQVPELPKKKQGVGILIHSLLRRIRSSPYSHQA